MTALTRLTDALPADPTDHGPIAVMARDLRAVLNPPPPRVVEHSVNAGRTWSMCQPHPRSPLAQILDGLDPYQVHDDGIGNLYRWRAQDGGS